MKTITSCIFGLIISMNLQAQLPSFEWAKSVGGSNSDRGKSITSDATGNVLVTGVFLATVDFDPGASTHLLTSNGDADIFIQKLASNGDFIWAKSIGGIFYDYGYSIITDAIGNVYVTGSFKDTVDFDPGAGVVNITPTGDYDFFILKLDPDGDFVWAKTVGSSFEDHSKSVNIDSAGNVYITGFFRDTADFDPGAGTFFLTSLGTSSAHAMFILKLNADGDFVWANSVGGEAFEEGSSLTFDASDNVYIIGNFYDTVDFDPGVGTFLLSSNGGKDIFVQKLTSGGDFLWATATGGIGSEDEGNSINIDASENIYITGRFYDSVDFNPGAGTFMLTSNGDADVFLQKLNSDGDFVWATSIGGISFDYGNAISTNTLGNIFITGNFNGTVDFNPGAGVHELTSTIGSDDNFILEIDDVGDFIGAISLGETNWNSGPFIATDTSDNVYVTGNFRGSADFDPGTGTHFLTSNGLSDIFVLKLNADPLSISENDFYQNISYYPNPTIDDITFDLNKTHERVNVIVMNYLGQIIHSKKIENSQYFTLNFESFASSIYIVKIIDNSGNRNEFKVIKK